MDGVAAKIAEEILILLEHGDVDAGARQQDAEHHAARAAAHDRARRRYRFHPTTKFSSLPGTKMCFRNVLFSNCERTAVLFHR